MAPDISKSALVIIDMQNDFVHRDGMFGRLAKRHPGGVDIDFLASAISPIKKLAAAYRAAGRPVVHIVHVVKPDYSDATFPHWHRTGDQMKNEKFIAEGTWGAAICDELTPHPDEHVIVKKGYGGFSNTPLDTILRQGGITTLVVTGVGTNVCVSSTIRGAVEHNYLIIVARDGVAAPSRETHEAELKTIERVFGHVNTSDEIVDMLKKLSPPLKKSA